MMKPLRALWALTGLLAFVGTVEAQTRVARLYWLGVLPGGNWSTATSVSNNGRVVGYSETDICCITCESPRAIHAFYWNGNMIDLHSYTSLEPDQGSIALDISADGNLVVGNAGSIVCSGYQQGAGQACAWVLEGTSIQVIQLQPLPLPYGSIANSVSYLSGKIAGTSGGYRSSADIGLPGIYLLDRSFTRLPLLHEGLGVGISHWGSAKGISGNGRVIVGISHYCKPADDDFDPCIWTTTRPVCWRDGSVYELEGGGTPHSASGSGSIIVGESSGAALWLGCPGRRIILSGSGVANDVNESGHIVVGTIGSQAYRWIAGRARGENLNQSYAPLLRDGSVLYEANGISPDGRYIVGIGFNASTGRWEAYLLDTGYSIIPFDVNEDSCVDDSDLLLVMYQLGSSGWLREDVNSDGIVNDLDLIEVLFALGQCSE